MITSASSQSKNGPTDVDPPDTRSAKQEARRTQILEAAAECFVTCGFHNAGMALIAKTAKMSVGHIYHYFENKDAIIAAIVQRDSQYRQERLRVLRQIPAEEFVDRFCDGVNDVVLRKANPYYTAISLEVLAECRRSPTVSKLVWEADKTFREGFAEILGGKLGLDNAAARVETLFSLIGGLTERTTRNPDLDATSIIPYFREAVHAILSKDGASA